MVSIVDYVEDVNIKTMINDVLRKFFFSDSNVDEELEGKLIEEVFDKIDFLEGLKDSLLDNDDGTIREVADRLNVSHEKVINTFIYFSLIVENIWLTKALMDSEEN